MKFSEAISQDKSQTISWVNNLRLISMFAVIVLHTTSPLLLNKQIAMQQWLVADFYNALVRFAVPVFVMITGALLLRREYDLGDFLKKRLGRIIIPFIFWSLVYVTYSWYNEDLVFTDSVWANTKLVLHQLQNSSYYHLWYVYTLIGLYLFIPVISKFVRNATENEILYFLAIWFFTMVFGKPYLNKYNTAIDLHYFAGYAGYLVLGYYLAYKQFNYLRLQTVAILIFAASTALITYGTYCLQLKNHELSTLFFEPIGPFVVILSVSAFLIAKYTGVKLNATLTKISDSAGGKYTLGIYLSHALILTLFDLFEINYKIFNPIFSIPLIAMVCFLLSWLLVWGLSKIPVVKYVAG